MKFATGGSAIFFGDVAKKCGWPVFQSITEVTFKDDEPYMPWCFWLDWDDSNGPPMKPDETWLPTNGHKPASVNIHINDFMASSQSLRNLHPSPEVLPTLHTPNLYGCGADSIS